MKNKRADITLIIVVVILIVAASFVLYSFITGSMGQVGSILSVKNPDVAAMAIGCGYLYDGNPEKMFCEDFRQIKIDGFFVTRYQLINCEYLNNSVRASIPGVEKFKNVVCPSDVWNKKCSEVLSMNDEGYSILINGKVCSIDTLEQIPQIIK